MLHTIKKVDGFFCFFNTIVLNYYFLFDFSVYCRKWEQLLDDTISGLVHAKEIVDDYKTKLAAEEQLSQTNKQKYK